VATIGSERNERLEVAAPVDDASAWRDCFCHWPDDLERRGVLVTLLNEQIPFDNFMTSGAMLLLERRTPDTIGARKVVVSYRQIAALKIVDLVKPRSFVGLGFELPPAKRGLA
jgi:hypothetical protein